MILFFSTSIEGGLIRLDDDESRHCLKVLRMGIGDIIHITDGRGNLFEAGISDVTSGRVTASVISTETRQPGNFRLHVAIAPTKNSDRLEWFIEKATEIGIDEITPVFCARSERTRVNHDRLKKILVSAVKQSLKTRLPRLNESSSLKDFLLEERTCFKFIASCLEGTEKEIQNVYTKGSDCVVLIGPEGDFSETEIESAMKAGYMPVSLGESRLRTETAGLYVTAVINLVNRM